MKRGASFTFWGASAIVSQREVCRDSYVKKTTARCRSKRNMYCSVLFRMISNGVSVRLHEHTVYRRLVIVIISSHLRHNEQHQQPASDL